jgi:lysophospholipase L1-like esterase
METRELVLLGIAGLGLFFAASLAYALRRDAVPRVVACLGDSLSDQYGYPDDLRALLPTGSRVRAFSYPGQGIEKIRDHLPNALDIEPTDLVVLGGVNDLAAGRGAKEVIEHLAHIYWGAKNGGTRVIGVTVTPWTGHLRGLENFEDTMVVNHWILNLSPADRAISTVAMGDANGYLYPAFDAGDGLHLNKTGFAALAKLISGAF